MTREAYTQHSNLPTTSHNPILRTRGRPKKPSVQDAPATKRKTVRRAKKSCDEVIEQLKLHFDQAKQDGDTKTISEIQENLK